MKTTKQQLNEFIGLHTECPWDEVYIEIVHSDSGVARAYTRGRALPIAVNGGSYNKVLSTFLNYYINDHVIDVVSCGLEEIIKTGLELGIQIDSLCDTKSGRLYKFTNLRDKK